MCFSSKNLEGSRGQVIDFFLQKAVVAGASGYTQAPLTFASDYRDCSIFMKLFL